MSMVPSAPVGPVGAAGPESGLSRRPTPVQPRPRVPVPSPTLCSPPVRPRSAPSRPDVPPPGSLSHPGGGLSFVELDVINEELDRLGELDPSVLADPESIVALHQVAARAEALATGATAAFDASGDWATDGARTAAAWVTTRCRVNKSEAKRRVRRGRELRNLPETTRAWAEGDITGAHVDVMISLRARGDRSGPGQRRGPVGRPGPEVDLCPVLPGRRLLEAAGRSRRGRPGRRAAPGPPGRLPGPELRRHLARGHEPRSHQRGHRRRRARTPGA